MVSKIDSDVPDLTSYASELSSGASEISSDASELSSDAPDHRSDALWVHAPPAPMGRLCMSYIIHVAI